MLGHYHISCMDRYAGRSTGWAALYLPAAGTAQIPCIGFIPVDDAGPDHCIGATCGTMKNRVANWLATIGRVPMFYCLLHIPLIHISALAMVFIQSGNLYHEWYATAPYSAVPPGQQWNLGMLYLVFIIDVIPLYQACRWYAQYKMSHPGKKWLAYI